MLMGISILRVKASRTHGVRSGRKVTYDDIMTVGPASKIRGRLADFLAPPEPAFMPGLTRIGLACCLALLAVAPAARAQRKVPDGAKVLILSGGQREHHGYREQALYLAGTLEDTRRFQVTIAEDAALVETPSLEKYDLVILTADRRDPEFRFTPGQQQAILAYVRAGHGFVSLHAADNAPADWLPDWKQMLGGVYSHVGLPDGKAIKGHYTVHIADPSSPITTGMADFELNDELYSNMQMLPGVRPLATIDHLGTTWPVAWTWTYGTGRVFHLSLGHRDFGPAKPDPLADPNLMKLLVRGVAFAAGHAPTP